jgi:hypothetical protein
MYTGKETEIGGRMSDRVFVMSVAKDLFRQPSLLGNYADYLKNEEYSVELDYIAPEGLEMN